MATTESPERADVLADIVLRDHDDQEVRLGDLWRDRTAALVWLRHYGWVHCRDHALQLQRAREQFEAAGAGLVLIGQATPRHAAHFRRTMELDLTVLADEQRESYAAVGARKGGVLQVLGPGPVIKGVLKARKSGVKGGKPIGDVNQLGGAIVVRPDGAVAWSYMSKDASDSAPVDELLAAARAAAQGG